jgi:hypothetical protein
LRVDVGLVLGPEGAGELVIGLVVLGEDRLTAVKDTERETL